MASHEVLPAKPGRPREALRTLIAAWADAYLASGASEGLTIDQIADQLPGVSSRSPSDCDAVRNTIKRMVEAGELVRKDRERKPGVCRPVRRFAPAVSASPESSAQLVASALMAWHRQSPAQPGSVEPQTPA